jgi:hypothetical protein
MHISESLVITPTLLRRFQAEGEMEEGDGRYYGVIQRDNGDLLVHHPASLSAVAPQLLWAGEVLRLLNRELHHDGAWVLVFTHPHSVPGPSVLHQAGHAEYRRYGLIWLDADGDPQFTMEWQHGTAELPSFTDVMLAGIESTAQKAEQAWMLWDDSHKTLDLKAEQTFKRAQGQRAPSARH